MRNRKAAGVCGIPPELLKYGGVESTREMTKKFNAVLIQEKGAGRMGKIDNYPHLQEQRQQAGL